MTRLTVALLQMASNGMDQQANAVKGEAFCRRAAGMGADIALFPEMWNIGYTWFDDNVPGAYEGWLAGAVDSESNYVTRFRKLARDLNMAIALTYLEKWQPRPRNTLALIDRHGKIAMTYSKVHTCDFDKECLLFSGDEFRVCELDTAGGPVKVGAMICYDREFPESARVLMLKGAEIILTPNACDLEINRLSQYRARAYENMVGVAMANYATPDQNGHSIAFDGMAYTQPQGGGDGASRDMLIVEAGEGEGIFLAPFDVGALRKYRAGEGGAGAYRKIGAYAALVATETPALP